MPSLGGKPCSPESFPDFTSCQYLLGKLNFEFRTIEAWCRRHVEAGSHVRIRDPSTDASALVAPSKVNCAGALSSTQFVTSPIGESSRGVAPDIDDLGACSERFSAMEKHSYAVQTVSSNPTMVPAACPEYHVYEDRAEEKEDNNVQVLPRRSWNQNANDQSHAEVADDLRQKARQCFELSQWFRHLDKSDKQYLTPEELLQAIHAVPGNDAKNLAWVRANIDTLRLTIEQWSRESEVHMQKTPSRGSRGSRGSRASRQSALSRTAAQSKASRSRSSSFYSLVPQTRATDDPFDMSLEDFVCLMLWDEVKERVTDYAAAARLLELREILIKACVDALIIECAHLKFETTYATRKRAFQRRIQATELTFGLLIFVNAVTLGFSVDYEWSGWDTVEGIFTGCFVVELGVRIWLYGVRAFFSEYTNLFDVVIVAVALVDLIFLLGVGSNSNLNKASVARIVRLIRLAKILRLVRLLRLRFFKELLMMIKGAAAGFRTLLWAIILLIAAIYMLSIILIHCTWDDQGRKLTYNGITLFPSMKWSMFTVYRCLVSDECNLRDGTPIAPLLYEKYGMTFLIPYYLVTVIIIFGVFNIIVAIFVESVMESARQRRQLFHEDESMRVCYKLRELVLKFGGVKEAELGPAASKGSQPKESVTFTNKIASLAQVTTHGSDEKHVVSFGSGGQISRDDFEAVIMQRSTLDILDDLEIHVSDRSQLFDVLDADGSGMVDVSEMISGLLRLRSGGADTSDVVATLLGMRSLHQRVRTVMIESVANQNKEMENQFRLETLIQDLDVKVSNLMVMNVVPYKPRTELTCA